MTVVRGGEDRPRGIPPEPAWEARFALQLLAALGLLFCCTLAFDHFVATPWTVEGESMTPTLSPGDRVLVEVWSYRHRPPRPGEIALIDGPEDLPMVKRVSGPSLSGPGIPPSALDPGDVGEDRFVVQGDNATSSLDSRQLGAVPRHRFLGRAVWRFWPLSKFGVVD